MRYLINKNPSSRNLFIFLKFEEIITIQSKNLGFVFSLTDISAPTIKGRKSYALHVWDKTNKPRKITSSPINATICFCLEKEIPVAQTLIKFLSRVIWFCLFVFLWMWLHRFEWRARELVEEVIYWWCVCVFIAMSRYLESKWVRYLKIHICRARNTCESDQLATFDTHY
jgi:hypothetical protein